MCLLCTTEDYIITGDIACCQEVTEINNINIFGNLSIIYCNKLVSIKNVNVRNLDITHCKNLKVIENVHAWRIYFYQLDSLLIANKIYTKSFTKLCCSLLVKLGDHIVDEFYWMGIN